MITAGDNVAVYHDGGGQSQYHFNMLKEVKFDRHRHYYEGADSFEQFLKTEYPVKLAGFHIPFPVEQDWLDRLEQMYDQVDHIYLFSSELHSRIEDQLRSLDRPKITMFINGIFRDPFEHARVYPWMDWFSQVVHFYKNIQPGFLEQHLAYGSKPLMFDALLGAQREHRDFVYWFVSASLNKDLYYMTYYHRIDQRLDNNTRFDMDEPNIEIIPGGKLTHSVDRVFYYGHELGLSQIVPLRIFNKTNYSIVAETNFSNTYSFPTEKVVKPLMAGRLFVAIAGQHYLKNLHSFGFKTFDSIIDESYDAEPDPKQRWSMAMQQCEWLCQQDPALILEQVKPIADHNKKLIFRHNWYGSFRTNFEREILSQLEHLKLK